VPAPERAGRHLALRRILAAVDGSPASGPAIDAAADLAVAVGAGIEVIHAAEEASVFPLGPAGRVTGEGEWDAPRRARQRLEPLCARARERHIPVHLTVQRGRPDEVVRQRAVDIDADLVVVATQRSGDPTQPLLASVSRRTAGFGHRPTLVVPVRAAGDQPARRIA
jgi:nucleotide-binding universal stress UspA family protein